MTLLVQHCLKALTHDHVAGSTRAAHVAGVLDVDLVVQQCFADRGASGRSDLSAFGAVFRMRQDFDNRHVIGSILDVLIVSFSVSWGVLVC